MYFHRYESFVFFAPQSLVVLCVVFVYMRGWNPSIALLFLGGLLHPAWREGDDAIGCSSNAPYSGKSSFHRLWITVIVQLYTTNGYQSPMLNTRVERTKGRIC